MATRTAGPRAAPGTGGVGSHTNVTRVFPFSPFAVPSQLRTYRPRQGSAVELSAFVTAVGTGGGGGAATFVASSLVSAQ